MNVYFCGMIGTGKTTIGLQLAEKLKLGFADLDREMDKRLGYSFHRLVAEEGWLAFRELEYAICRDFSLQTDSVICLGGGTVRYDYLILIPTYIFKITTGMWMCSGSPGGSFCSKRLWRFWLRGWLWPIAPG